MLRQADAKEETANLLELPIQPAAEEDAGGNLRQLLRRQGLHRLQALPDLPQESLVQQRHSPPLRVLQVQAALLKGILPKGTGKGPHIPFAHTRRTGKAGLRTTDGQAGLRH